MESVLLIEQRPFHYEVIPGFAYYLVELGYEVDCCCFSHNTTSGDEFSLCAGLKSKVNFIYFDEKGVLDTIRNQLCAKKYAFIFIDTLDAYPPSDKTLIYSGINNFENTKLGIIGCYHGYFDYLKNVKHYGENIDINRIVSISDGGGFTEVNPNYFKEDNLIKHKNKDLKIISIGKYFDFIELINATDSLYSETGYLPLVNVVRRDYNKKKFLKGQLKRILVYPIARILHISKYNSNDYKPMRTKARRQIKIKTGILFEEMFELINDADFIVINSALRGLATGYYENRTSGSKQLVLGFCKPPIIEKEKADYYGFSDDNAVIYEGNNLASALKRAYEMSDEEYCKLQENLMVLQQQVRKRSKDNLEKLINGLR